MIEFKIKSLLKFENNITFYNHHFSHAASAFYPSPYNDAAILVVDAVGEWDCTSLGVGINNKIASIIYGKKIKHEEKYKLGHYVYLLHE